MTLRSERGTAAIELALLAPVLVVLVAVVAAEIGRASCRERVSSVV